MTEPAPPAKTATPAPPAPATAPTEPAPSGTQPEEARNLMAFAADAGRPESTGLTGDEERQLAELQEKSVRARAGVGGTVELRIVSPHSEVSYGNHKVTREWTPTPAWLVATFASQAADSGVEIEQREEG